MNIIENPTAGGLFYTKQDLLRLYRENTDSLINKYEKAMLAQFQHLQDDPEHRQSMHSLIDGMEYARCVYCRLEGDELSVVEGYVLIAHSNDKVWPATLAIKLAGETGTTSLYIVMYTAVNTLVIDGERSKVVILADYKNADRIAKILSRSGEGKPWMQVVR